MLTAELGVEFILEETKCRVLVTRNRNRCSLVLGGVYLDVVLQRVVVDVIWGESMNDQREAQDKSHGWVN